MKERPILFSAPMVRALLAGTKTQTRRVVKHPATEYIAGADGDRNDPRNFGYEADDGEWYTLREQPRGASRAIACPYGQPGDRLWVREKMRRVGAITRRLNGRPLKIDVEYAADRSVRLEVPFPNRLKGVPKHGQCLAYGGYREASRITLEITDVCVQRLQEISEEDARAEGQRFSEYTGHKNTKMHSDPTDDEDLFGSASA